MKLWHIPDEGLTRTLVGKDALVTCSGHMKKLSTIKFHPTVQNILGSVSAGEYIYT